MSFQYWVGDFFIDLTRNQVTYDHQTQTVPPKALAVLTCLAKNANKVVSQDELLTDVWPDTIVTPNTLQRSIAQLRKVLGANLESQSYIKTHAKQGYSLECEVRWQANITTPKLSKRSAQPANETATETRSASGTVGGPPRHLVGGRVVWPLCRGVRHNSSRTRHGRPTLPRWRVPLRRHVVDRVCSDVLGGVAQYTGATPAS